MFKDLRKSFNNKLKTFNIYPDVTNLLWLSWSWGGGVFKCITFNLSIPGDSLVKECGLYYMIYERCLTYDLTDCYSALGVLLYDKCFPGPHECSKPEKIC